MYVEGELREKLSQKSQINDFFKDRFDKDYELYMKKTKRIISFIY